MPINWDEELAKLGGVTQPDNPDTLSLDTPVEEAGVFGSLADKLQKGLDWAAPVLDPIMGAAQTPQQLTTGPLAQAIFPETTQKLMAERGLTKDTPWLQYAKDAPALGDLAGEALIPNETIEAQDPEGWAKPGLRFLKGAVTLGGNILTDPAVMAGRVLRAARAVPEVVKGVEALELAKAFQKGSYAAKTFGMPAGIADAAGAAKDVLIPLEKALPANRLVLGARALDAATQPIVSATYGVPAGVAGLRGMEQAVGPDKTAGERVFGAADAILQAGLMGLMAKGAIDPLRVREIQDASHGVPPDPARRAQLEQEHQALMEQQDAPAGQPGAQEGTPAAEPAPPSMDATGKALEEYHYRTARLMDHLLSIVMRDNPDMPVDKASELAAERARAHPELQKVESELQSDYGLEPEEVAARREEVFQQALNRMAGNDLDELNPDENMGRIRGFGAERGQAPEPAPGVPDSGGMIEEEGPPTSAEAERKPPTEPAEPGSDLVPRPGSGDFSRPGERFAGRAGEIKEGVRGPYGLKPKSTSALQALEEELRGTPQLSTERGTALLNILKTGTKDEKVEAANEIATANLLPILRYVLRRHTPYRAPGGISAAPEMFATIRTDILKALHGDVSKIDSYRGLIDWNMDGSPRNTFLGGVIREAIEGFSTEGKVGGESVAKAEKTNLYDYEKDLKAAAKWAFIQQKRDRVAEIDKELAQPTKGWREELSRQLIRRERAQLVDEIQRHEAGRLPISDGDVADLKITAEDVARYRTRPGAKTKQTYEDKLLGPVDPKTGERRTELGTQHLHELHDAGKTEQLSGVVWKGDDGDVEVEPAARADIDEVSLAEQLKVGSITREDLRRLANEHPEAANVVDKVIELSKQLPDIPKPEAAPEKPSVPVVEELLTLPAGPKVGNRESIALRKGMAGARSAQYQRISNLIDKLDAQIKRVNERRSWKGERLTAARRMEIVHGLEAKQERLWERLRNLEKKGIGFPLGDTAQNKRAAALARQEKEAGKHPQPQNAKEAREQAERGWLPPGQRATVQTREVAPSPEALATPPPGRSTEPKEPHLGGVESGATEAINRGPRSPLAAKEVTREVTVDGETKKVQVLTLPGEEAKTPTGPIESPQYAMARRMLDYGKTHPEVVGSTRVVEGRTLKLSRTTPQPQLFDKEKGAWRPLTRKEAVTGVKPERTLPAGFLYVEDITDRANPQTVIDLKGRYVSPDVRAAAVETLAGKGEGKVYNSYGMDEYEYADGVTSGGRSDITTKLEQMEKEEAAKPRIVGESTRRTVPGEIQGVSEAPGERRERLVDSGVREPKGWGESRAKGLQDMALEDRDAFDSWLERSDVQEYDPRLLSQGDKQYYFDSLSDGQRAKLIEDAGSREAAIELAGFHRLSEAAYDTARGFTGSVEAAREEGVRKGNVPTPEERQKLNADALAKAQKIPGTTGYRILNPSGVADELAASITKKYVPVMNLMNQFIKKFNDIAKTSPSLRGLSLAAYHYGVNFTHGQGIFTNLHALTERALRRAEELGKLTKAGPSFMAALPRLLAEEIVDNLIHEVSHSALRKGDGLAKLEAHDVEFAQHQLWLRRELLKQEPMMVTELANLISSEQGNYVRHLVEDYKALLPHWGENAELRESPLLSAWLRGQGEPRVGETVPVGGRAGGTGPEGGVPKGGEAPAGKAGETTPAGDDRGRGGDQEAGAGVRQAEGEAVASSEEVRDVYHGTPREDPFDDFSKHGYGKTYTHGVGHYFTSSKEMGEFYRKSPEGRQGRLYKTTLAPDETSFLDLDIPLRNQEKPVQQRLQRLYRHLQQFTPEQLKERTGSTTLDGMTGHQLLSLLDDYMGSPEGASDILKTVGIPGNKYDDSGTKNFVVFDSKNVKIDSVEAAKEPTPAQLRREQEHAVRRFGKMVGGKEPPPPLKKGPVYTSFDHKLNSIMDAADRDEFGNPLPGIKPRGYDAEGNPREGDIPINLRVHARHFKEPFALRALYEGFRILEEHGILSRVEPVEARKMEEAGQRRVEMNGADKVIDEVRANVANKKTSYEDVMATAAVLDLRWKEFTAASNILNSAVEKKVIDADKLAFYREKKARAARNLLDAQYVFAETRTSAGRALRASGVYQKKMDPMSNEFGDIMRRLQRKGLSKRDLIAAKDAYEKMINGGVDELEAFRQFVGKAMDPGLHGKLLEFWQAGLISGPITRVTNNASNYSFGILRNIEQTVAAGFDKLRSAATGKDRSIYAGELPWVIRAHMEALPIVLKNLRRDNFGYTMGPLHPISQGMERGEWRQSGAIGAGPEWLQRVTKGKLNLGEAVRMAFKRLEVDDDAGRTIAAFEETAREAYRMAKKEHPDLSGEAFDAKVKANIEEIQQHRDHFRDLNPDSPAGQKFLEIIDRINKAAEERTFQTPAEGAAGAIKEFIERNNWVKWVVPFYQTPLNITKEAAKRSVLGIPWALYNSKGILEALKGDDPVAARKAVDNLAKIALGNAIFAAAVGAGMSGVITGGGPTDPKKRRQKMQTGWQPYSFHFGDQYISFSRIEPFATILGFAGDAAEGIKEGDIYSIQTAGVKGVGSLAENLTNKTFLAGLSALAEAWNDPKRYAEAWIKQMGGSMVPMSGAMGTYARVLDPVKRDTTWKTAPLARIPLLSKTLPAQVGTTGEERRYPGSAVERLVSPFYRSEKQHTRAEKVSEVLDQIGYVPPEPRDYMKPFGGPKTFLTQAEKQALNDARQKATLALYQVINDPSFKSLPDNEDAAAWKPGRTTKEMVLSRFYRRYMDAALARVKPGVAQRALKEQQSRKP